MDFYNYQNAERAANSFCIHNGITTDDEYDRFVAFSKKIKSTMDYLQLNFKTGKVDLQSEGVYDVWTSTHAEYRFNRLCSLRLAIRYHLNGFEE